MRDSDLVEGRKLRAVRERFATSLNVVGLLPDSNHLRVQLACAAVQVLESVTAGDRLTMLVYHLDRATLGPVGLVVIRAGHR